MKLLKLSQIWVYPIKSIGGISLATAKVLPKGLEHDRRWMLIDENGMFMTQRNYPQMALLKVSMTEDHIKVAYHNDTLNIPLALTHGSPIRAGIWNDEVSVIPPGTDFDNWFSKRIGMDCRLVWFPEENPRIVEAGFRSDEDHVGLQDAFPFLVIGQSSLDELNSRLATLVPINRFRPNFVFTGGDPHEEDTWQSFSIGDLPFLGTKPCSRCTIPGIDQDTGLKDKEPLATLAKYRQQGNKIKFGMNVIGPGYGEVTVGDEIRVTVAENIR